MSGLKEAIDYNPIADFYLDEERSLINMVVSNLRTQLFTQS